MQLDSTCELNDANDDLEALVEEILGQHLATATAEEEGCGVPIPIPACRY